MADTAADPFVKFKEVQREGWSLFVPVEMMTMRPAAKLVNFAQVRPGQRVLDLACGAGVVAVTAARLGAKVSGLDLTPALLERARENARIAGVDIDFTEGDAEALPYPDGSFDVVLSQFGHIFAPRPPLAVKEMLRVLKSGGRVAFATWPPEHFIGQMFALIARNMPPPPPGAELPAPPPLWGDPNVIRDRLGKSVKDVKFARDTLVGSALSLAHFRAGQEKTVGPLSKLVASLQGQPEKLKQLRDEYDAMAADIFKDNAVHLDFLMTRATKI